jgi:hypothetical protein
LKRSYFYDIEGDAISFFDHKNCIQNDISAEITDCIIRKFPYSDFGALSVFKWLSSDDRDREMVNFLVSY